MERLFGLTDTKEMIIDKSGIYPRIHFLQGASLVEVRDWYNFGSIATIYMSTLDFLEIEKLPGWIKDGVNDNFGNNPMIKINDTLALDFFSASPDFDESQNYLVWHFCSPSLLFSFLLFSSSPSLLLLALLLFSLSSSSSSFFFQFHWDIKNSFSLNFLPNSSKSKVNFNNKNSHFPFLFISFLSFILFFSLFSHHRHHLSTSKSRRTVTTGDPSPMVTPPFPSSSLVHLIFLFSLITIYYFPLIFSPPKHLFSSLSLT